MRGHPIAMMPVNVPAPVRQGFGGYVVATVRRMALGGQSANDDGSVPVNAIEWLSMMWPLRFMTVGADGYVGSLGKASVSVPASLLAWHGFGGYFTKAY